MWFSQDVHNVILVRFDTFLGKRCRPFFTDFHNVAQKKIIYATLEVFRVIFTGLYKNLKVFGIALGALLGPYRVAKLLLASQLIK